MDRRAIATMVAAFLLAAAAGCTKSSAPLTPTAAASATVPDASLKATVPVPQSPINNQQLSSLTSAPFVATAAAGQFTTMVLRYRFQVFNDAGVLVQDSGLMTTPSWTMTVALTPLARYTWKVRAEYDGTAGAWSSTATFTTPEQPPAYNRPIGNWQACASITKELDLVFCVWNAVRPTDSVSDLEVVKRVAWLLRGAGAGLLIKTSGDNIVNWREYSFSASRICYPDGHVFKIIGDAGPGGANSPTFADNDFVARSLYVPAIDPSKP